MSFQADDAGSSRFNFLFAVAKVQHLEAQLLLPSPSWVAAKELK